MNRLRLLVITALLGAPLGVSAHQPTVPKPDARMSEMSIFNGTWRCTGKILTAKASHGGTFTATVVGKRTLGGFWYRFVYQQQVAGHKGITSECAAGYDAKAKKFQLLCVDSWGFVGSLTSTGWKDQLATFYGSFSGQGHSFPVRRTFQKKPDGSMITTVFMPGKDKKWHPMSQSTCKR